MKIFSPSGESVAGISAGRKFGFIALTDRARRDGVGAPALAARRHHAAPAAAPLKRRAPPARRTLRWVLMPRRACSNPSTGTVIFEANDRTPWPTASLAKMMLMLIVAEKIHDGSLKLTDTDHHLAQSGRDGRFSQVYLKEGEDVFARRHDEGRRRAFGQRCVGGSRGVYRGLDRLVRRDDEPAGGRARHEGLALLLGERSAAG